MKRRKGERGGEGEACKIQIQLYGKNAMTVSNNYYWFKNTSDLKAGISKLS